MVLKTMLICIRFWCYILLSSKREKLLKEGGSHTNGKINYLTYLGRQAIESRLEIMYLALINRAGGLYGRILTEVVSTDRTQ